VGKMIGNISIHEGYDRYIAHREDLNGRYRYENLSIIGRFIFYLDLSGWREAVNLLYLAQDKFQ
jgi:hypothetical protein